MTRPDFHDKTSKIYRCDHYQIARSQREREVRDRMGLEGTQGYQNMGCYECLGVNQGCKAYQTELKISILEDL